MSQTTSCDWCGEEILLVARKCKHCGEFLELEPAEEAEGAVATPAVPSQQEVLQRDNDAADTWATGDWTTTASAGRSGNRRALLWAGIAAVLLLIWGVNALGNNTASKLNDLSEEIDSTSSVGSSSRDSNGGSSGDYDAMTDAEVEASLVSSICNLYEQGQSVNEIATLIRRNATNDDMYNNAESAVRYAIGRC